MATTQGMLVELLDLERVEAVLICIPCLEVRQAQPDMLLGLHDPGDLREQWGCPIQGCGKWFIGPWYLESHTAAEHPGWTATYELRRPYPNQRMRVVYRQVEDPGLGLVWPWGLVALQAVDGLSQLVQDVDDHDVQHPGSAAQGGQFAQLGDLLGEGHGG